MRIGEKLYCKKTLKFLDDIYYIKGKLYVIISIDDNIMNVSDEINNCSCFHISEASLDEYKLRDYFLTEKEYRKLKLKKIYGCNLCKNL